MTSVAPPRSTTPANGATPFSASPPSSPNLRADEPRASSVRTVPDDADGTRRRPLRSVTVDTTGSRPSGRRATTESARSSRSRRTSVDPNAGVLRRMTTGLLTPDHTLGKAPTYGSSIKAAITSTWLNLLLVFIPIGWALYFAKHSGGVSSISDTAVFCTTFIAIIPLAGLLGFATEEAALRLGETLGGLLNATLGNAVELIVAILALIKCELAVVQSSLVGSILSNLLLVLGMCFFAGGVRFAEQTVKTTAAQLNASLLLFAVIAVLIPSAFHFSITTSEDGAGFSITDAQLATDLLAMSHGVAVILLVLYLGYLAFQMWTHANLYEDDPGTTSTQFRPEVVAMQEKLRNFHPNLRRRKNDELGSPTAGSDETANTAGNSTAVAPGAGQDVAMREINDVERGDGDGDDEEGAEQPQMNMVVTVGVMVLDAVLVGVTAEFLVDSIDGMVASNPSLSSEWVGLILLPIIGNAAEHYTAVAVSVKDKLDLSISVAVGSSIQIALFVIPVIQLLAWCIGKPMTLLFDPYESIVLFLTVLIVNQTLADGRSNWMEGLTLMFVYLIIAVSFWYYPGSDTATLLGCQSEA
ncbi:Vacuolar calcium ion transporter [Cryptotrichosporon argae]